MYYALLALCAAMFSTQFFFSQMFQRSYGSGIRAMLVTSMGGSIVGIIALSFINGFQFACTPFALIMAVAANVNSMVFSFCSLQALKKCNLSLYSMFSMLGGMALPFVAGILFFEEALTFGKVICFAFITGALLLTLKKDDKRGGAIYYIGIFLFNGMAGVISKLYQAGNYAKVTSAQYSVLCAIIGFILALILFLLLSNGEKKRLNVKSVVAICGGGLLNKFANFFLLISLTCLPASAQYPFITGGTMVFSTLICYITRQKPSKNELLAVAFSFLGVLMLVIL